MVSAVADLEVSEVAVVVVLEEQEVAADLVHDLELVAEEEEEEVTEVLVEQVAVEATAEVVVAVAVDLVESEVVEVEEDLKYPLFHSMLKMVETETIDTVMRLVTESKFKSRDKHKVIF